MLSVPVFPDVLHARAAMRVAVRTAAVGRPFLAAVEIQTDPHWHIYWKNPGDSGIPTTIDWHAPPGWKVEPLEFPIPTRFAPNGIAAYGYEGKTLFLARVTPTARSGFLSANVKWLVCANACIPGGAMLKTSVSVGPRGNASAMARHLDKAEEALPIPISPWRVRALAGKRVVLTASYTPGRRRSVGIHEFFPLQSGVVDHAKPWFATYEEFHLVFKMDPSSFPEKRSTLAGLIVSTRGGRRGAFSLNVKLEKGNPQ